MYISKLKFFLFFKILKQYIYYIRFFFFLYFIYHKIYALQIWMLPAIWRQNLWRLHGCELSLQGINGGQVATRVPQPRKVNETVHVQRLIGGESVSCAPPTKPPRPLYMMHLCMCLVSSTHDNFVYLSTTFVYKYLFS